MPGVLDAYLDVLRCAHCRSPKVEAQAVQLTRGSKFCLCRACGGEFRVSSKKWTKYERRAEALFEAVAKDAARLYPADHDGRRNHVDRLEKWLAHLGLPGATRDQDMRDRQNPTSRCQTPRENLLRVSR